MKWNKLGSVLLALMMVVAFSVPAFAAEAAPHDAVETMRQQLEEKYGIRITYDLDPDGTPCVGTGSLYTLDLALNAVTPSVVRQVSAYYQQTLGQPLTYSYLYSPYHDESNPYMEVLGSFVPETAVIEIYVPYTSSGTFMTGNSPITVAHEFGHAFYIMYIEKYGESTLRSEWTALNNGTAYTWSAAIFGHNEQVFVSSYGATSFEEDFAEVFAHALVRNRAGQGFAHQMMVGGNKTALGRKVDYIANMLSRSLSDTGTAVANIQASYNVPSTLVYQGIQLGGEDLQFIGCASPRYVLNGLMGLYGVSAMESEWIIEIGGWQVLDSDGDWLLVFPGGYYELLDQRLPTAA